MNNQDFREMDFSFKFRGTRGSYPTPNKDFLEFGGNTACVEVNCGLQKVILDAGTGIIDVGKDEIKKAKVSKDFRVQTNIFLSHIHQDHIQGLQFYRPLFFPSSKINLFGMPLKNENLKDILKNILFDKVFPLAIDEITSDFSIKNCYPENIVVISQDGNVCFYNKDSEKNVFKRDDIKIYSYISQTHPKNGSMCFKVEYMDKSLVYATDVEASFPLEPDFYLFVKNCDCLIHDAQYTDNDYNSSTSSKIGYGHSTFSMAMEVKNRVNAKKLFFFHYDPDYDDKMLSRIENVCLMKNEGVFFAKENLKIIV